MEDKLEKLIAPIVTGFGVAFYGYEYVIGQRLLRVYIDHPDGVTIDTCAKVSRELSHVLDAEQAITLSAYRLEVSSPGIERPLLKLIHYQHNLGKLIQVRCKLLVLGRRRLVGKLIEANELRIVLQVDKADYPELTEDEVTIPFNQIEKARCEFVS